MNPQHSYLLCFGMEHSRLQTSSLPIPIRLYPPGKESKFNRINGSPGDPPGNRMHRVINHRIVPNITRLAGDPIGKEAGRETTIGDTKHVNQYTN